MKYFDKCSLNISGIIKSLILILMITSVTNIFCFSEAQMNEVIIEVIFEQEEFIANYSHNSSGPYKVVGNVTCEITGFKAEDKSALITLEIFDERDWGPGITPAQFNLRNGEYKLVNISFNVPPGVNNRTRNTFLIKGSWVLYPNIRDSHSTGNVESGSFEVIVNRTSAARYPTGSTSSDDPIDEPRGLLDVEGVGIIILLIVIPVTFIILIIYIKKNISETKMINELIDEEHSNK
jgi:hypothetical protein